MSLGKHIVTFRALSPAAQASSLSLSTNSVSKSSSAASCQLIVHVKDADPPRVRHCPRSFTTHLSAGVSSAPVSWQEPVFSDNVGVSHVMATFLPGHRFGPGVHNVLYTATDADGNRARCGFTVTVREAVVANSFRGEGLAGWLLYIFKVN